MPVLQLKASTSFLIFIVSDFTAKQIKFRLMITAHFYWFLIFNQPIKEVQFQEQQAPQVTFILVPSHQRREVKH